MTKKNRYHIVSRILTVLDQTFTFVDALLFMYYSVIRLVVKEKRKIEIRQAKNFKKRYLQMDWKVILNESVKMLNKHHEYIPFILRIIPTGIVALIVILLLW